MATDAHTPQLSDGIVLLRVRAALPLLGPSERRVAQVILDRPGAVTEWSTAELATEAATSAATVVRACQNLGFRGFQHLRLEVARAAPTENAPVDTHPLARIFADAADAIDLGRASVNLAAIDAAVAAIHAEKALPEPERTAIAEQRAVETGARLRRNNIQPLPPDATPLPSLPERAGQELMRGGPTHQQRDAARRATALCIEAARREWIAAETEEGWEAWKAEGGLRDA